MAGCVPIPVIPQPVLPSGFSLNPPDPFPLPYPLGVCCQTITFPAVLPPIPLPPFTVNLAFIAAVTAGIRVAQAYLDAIPLTCPKE